MKCGYSITIRDPRTARSESVGDFVGRDFVGRKILLALVRSEVLKFFPVLVRAFPGFLSFFPVLVRFGPRTRTEPLSPGPISFSPWIPDYHHIK